MWIDTTTWMKKKTIGKCTFYHIIFNRDFAALFGLLLSNDCIYFRLKLNITLNVYYEFFFMIIKFTHFFICIFCHSQSIFGMITLLLLHWLWNGNIGTRPLRIWLFWGNISKHSMMKIRLFLKFVVVFAAVVHAD